MFKLTTMETIISFSVAQLEQLRREQELLLRRISSGAFPLDETMIVDEIEVAKFLNVTDRTMRTYRKERFFRYIKIRGRILYLKPLLFEDLVRLSMADGRPAHPKRPH